MFLDRENQQRAKVLSNMVKQKRKEKAGKWDVPLPKGLFFLSWSFFIFLFSTSASGGWGLQNDELWQAKKESMEANGHESLLCARRFYKKEPKIWKIHSPDGDAIQESARHSSWAQGIKINKKLLLHFRQPFVYRSSAWRRTPRLQCLQAWAW